MANDYYNTTEIVPLTRGRSRVRNDEFNAVEDGFDLLPSLAQTFGGLATYAGDSTGSSNAYAVTMPETRTSNADGEEVVFIANHTNTGGATLNVDGIGAVSMVSYDGTALEAGDIVSGLIFVVRYDASNTRFQLVSPTGQEFGDLAFLDTVGTAQIEDDAVTTDKIADLAVTTAKIKDDNVTSGKLATNLTLVGDVTVDTGGIILEAGEGIDFSDNTESSVTGVTVNSELLDWHEEGFWTPTLLDDSLSAGESQAYTANVGTYTRTGNTVHFSGRIVMNGLGSLTTSHAAKIGGLPFRAAIILSMRWGVSVEDAAGLDKVAGQNLSGYIPASEAPGTNVFHIVLQAWDDAGGTTDLTISEVSADGDLTFSGFYVTS